MVWVKVCGISKRADLDAAVEAGADAVGLVLAAGTPRCITVEQARRLAEHSPVPGIVVTVDESPEDLMELAERVGAGGVQPHGERQAQAAEAGVRNGLMVLRPVRVGSGGVSVDHVPGSQIPILDTADARRHGGTGRTFDHDALPPLHRRWVLAGGMGPHNVAEAIEKLQPWGVDASSHLESELGVKDPGRIQAFGREAKGQ